MSFDFSHTSGVAKIIIIFEFLLVAYLIYSLTKNVYNSYLVDRYIETFERENAMIADENQKKNDDYLYFTSQEYIDKIAKQNLGLINPGEEVIIVAPESLTYKVNSDQDSEFDEASDDLSSYDPRSNPQIWWDFFFK